MFPGRAFAEFTVDEVLGFFDFLEPRPYLRYHVHALAELQVFHVPGS